MATNAFAYTPCVGNAIRRVDASVEMGRLARYGHGLWKGEPHCWPEYWDGEKWVLDRDTIAGQGPGWPVSEYTTNGVEDYTVIYYGYPACQKMDFTFPENETEKCI